MRVLIIAMVVGCTTANAQPPAAATPACAGREPSPEMLAALPPELAQAALANAAYCREWVAKNGGAVTVPSSSARGSVAGTVSNTAPAKASCPKTAEEVDTPDERIACLEDDVGYLFSLAGVK